MMILDKAKPFTIIRNRKDKGKYIQNGMVFTQGGLPFIATEVEPEQEETKKPSMMTFNQSVTENKPLPGSSHDPKEKKKRTKLCLNDARNIRRKHAEGVSKKSLVEEFKISNQTINKVLAGTTLPEPNMPERLQEKRGRDFNDQESIEMLPEEKG